MDWVEGHHWHPVDDAHLVPQLTHTLQIIHHMNYVLGDLRKPNVLVTPDHNLYYLIDFDWAGPLGEARWPLTRSAEPLWPQDTNAGGIITRENDTAMLSRHFQKLML